MFKDDFDYESLDYEQREAIHNALGATTEKHITRAPDLFKPSGFNPAANPSHLLETVHLNPVPTKCERVNTLALAAGPSFYPPIQETFSKQRAFMSAARLILGRGEHIFVVTGPHGNIADVAEFSAGWSEHLDQEDWQEQNGLIISRGVTTIEAFGTAASQVVQEIGHVFMSFPRTNTIEELVIDDDVLSLNQFDSLINTNNKNMRKEARSWLGVDIAHKIGRHVIGKSLHQAWEGKTAVVKYGDNHQPEQIELQKVHPGIIDILKYGHVLPVTIWDGDNPVVELGELSTVKTEADIQRIQEWQRKTLADRLGLFDEAVTIAAS